MIIRLTTHESQILAAGSRLVIALVSDNQLLNVMIGEQHAKYDQNKTALADLCNHNSASIVYMRPKGRRDTVVCSSTGPQKSVWRLSEQGSREALVFRVVVAMLGL